MKIQRFVRLGLVAGAVMLLAGCWERPPVEMVQHGYRGTGMAQVYNPRTLVKQQDLNKVPVALPAAPAEGPKAKEIYKNVQVLGDLSVAQFTRLMASMATWVSPNDGGCVYCHNPANFAEDSKYTKVVARRMLQMTQYINANWQQHVAETGVTCYTCHRGHPKPQDQNGQMAYWYAAGDPAHKGGMLGWRDGQNEPAYSVGAASLPNEPFSRFLLGDSNIRVQSQHALPMAKSTQDIKATEWTYGLMIHMSKSLGVNCDYCHNSRAFSSWPQSAPQRVTAWYGIRMVRNLNNEFLDPLKPVYDADDLGPKGDAPKLFCATCHKGAYKPLYGQSMLKDFPELSKPSTDGKPLYPAEGKPAAEEQKVAAAQ
ncbi:MAG: photosynthetic reaction center cytochrome c subunit [Rhodocyclaceae bacterium]|nr:photosynthetic reaction center cytochrome c subunit [Rhodocyclaceae bacterium]